jgi:serine/threonine-protein kinase PpkA
MRADRRIVTAILALIVAIAPWISAYAQPTAGQRKPLLIEGKTTLYQRVLTRPGAAVSAQPGGAAGKELPPMTLLFVYGKQAAGATNYLEVGSNSEGRVIGFLPEADTIPWKHSLTLAFTNPANRERVLFFKDRPGLVDMLNSDKLLVDSEQIRKQIAEGKLPPTSPVVSIEPETFVDMQKQFYLLPILDAGTTMLTSGFKVRTVQVASVTKEKGGGYPCAGQPAQQSGGGPRQVHLRRRLRHRHQRLDAAVRRPHPRGDAIVFTHRGCKESG